MKDSPAHRNSSRCRSSRQLQTICSLDSGVGVHTATDKANAGQAKRNAASLVSVSRMRRAEATLHRHGRPVYR